MEVEAKLPELIQCQDAAPAKFEAATADLASRERHATDRLEEMVTNHALLIVSEHFVRERYCYLER